MSNSKEKKKPDMILNAGNTVYPQTARSNHFSQFHDYDYTVVSKRPWLNLVINQVL